MSEFVVNTDLFGYYAKIPTGFSREMHTYKVISVFQSNSYCDIPLMTIYTKKTLHKKITNVLNVIHCGIDESEVIRVALKDCEIIRPTANEKAIMHGEWIIKPNANGGGHYVCSKCGACQTIIKKYRNYCGQCGAKMDGDVK